MGRFTHTIGGKTRLFLPGTFSIVPQNLGHRRMKVLIAEDNQNMRQMIRDIIAEPSIELFECSSGIEAIESYEREHPDCVLMDVEMSPVDGITATRVIKKSHPEAKIVIVTQHTDRLTRTAAAEAGADGFVAKDNLLEAKAFVERLLR